MITPVCTDSSAAAGEPLIGTAGTYRGWLCLQQQGAWGRQALVESDLDPAVGATLSDRADSAGIRPTLIRHPGRPSGDTTRPWLYLAHTDAPEPWLLARQLDDPREVLEVDLEALAEGDQEAFPGFTPVDHELLFVCTNGKRDTCCARLGRPVAAAAAAAYPDRVWEISHTGGHRFAPTAVTLPSGHLHGRVLDGAALLSAADRGELPLATWRGRSTWPADAQAAEEFVRRSRGLTGLSDVAVAAHDADWVVTVPGGEQVLVRVTHQESGMRAESCGKDLKPVVHRVASLVE